MDADRLAAALACVNLDTMHPDDAEYWREKADLALNAMFEPVASLTDDGAADRLRDAAYRDSALTISVRAADLRSFLRATQRYVLHKTHPEGRG